MSKCEKIKYVACINRKAIKNLYVLLIPMQENLPDPLIERVEETHFFLNFRGPALLRLPEYGYSFQNG